MKLSHLSQISKYLQLKSNIYSIYRSSDNIIAIVFDDEETIYFNMQRGNSYIFKNDHIQRNKVYQAPFDVVLHKRLNRASILNIELYNNDKILRITTSQNSTYKQQLSTIQFEFTGKYTNAIILDENGVILEAVRHIDSSVSSRVVKVGYELEELPLPTYEAKEYKVDDINSYLYLAYNAEEEKHLSLLKKQKIALLEKKIDTLRKRLNSLENEENLQNSMLKNQNIGNIILANMHKIKPYMSEIVLDDFDGTEMLIKFDKSMTSASQIGNHYFKKAKKEKQKIINLHIERENLEQKIDHLKHFVNTVEEAESISTIEMLFPNKQQLKKVKKEDDSCATFWIEGYKVTLGKNEKGNILLLQKAKARDIWIHLKDRPSTHVIISTDKQNLPDSVIYSAAKLCVDFSLFEKGNYLVDYTARREVKVQDGANVLYNKYKTITVKKG